MSAAAQFFGGCAGALLFFQFNYLRDAEVKARRERIVMRDRIQALEHALNRHQEWLIELDPVRGSAAMFRTKNENGVGPSSDARWF